MSCFWTSIFFRKLLNKSTQEHILFYNAKDLLNENKKENKNIENVQDSKEPNLNSDADINNINKINQNPNKNSFKKFKKLRSKYTSKTNVSYNCNKINKLSSKLNFSLGSIKLDIEPISELKNFKGISENYKKCSKINCERAFSVNDLESENSDSSLDQNAIMDSELSIYSDNKENEIQKINANNSEINCMI